MRLCLSFSTVPLPFVLLCWWLLCCCPTMLISSVLMSYCADCYCAAVILCWFLLCCFPTVLIATVLCKLYVFFVRRGMTIIRALSGEFTMTTTFIRHCTWVKFTILQLLHCVEIESTKCIPVQKNTLDCKNKTSYTIHNNPSTRHRWELKLYIVS